MSKLSFVKYKIWVIDTVLHNTINLCSKNMKDLNHVFHKMLKHAYALIHTMTSLFCHEHRFIALFSFAWWSLTNSAQKMSLFLFRSN